MGSLLPGSVNSAARERGEKPVTFAPPSSRPGPFARGGSSKELPDSPTPEEPQRDREREGAEPRRQSVTEDKEEPDSSGVREPGETHRTEIGNDIQIQSVSSGSTHGCLLIEA